MRLELTEHVCLRFIERFNPNLNSIKDYQSKIDRAKVAIKSIVENAHYVSDDPRGILLYSPTHNCNLIIRNKRLITLYPPDQKQKDREKKYNLARYKKAANDRF